MRIARPSPFASPGGTPPQPPQPPPRRKHTGGHPRASDETTAAVLTALDAGASYTAAARAGNVSPATARRWWHENRDGEPPGKGRGAGKGGGHRSALDPAKVREALGARQANGRWEHSAKDAAAKLGVSASALYRALERERKSKP